MGRRRIELTPAGDAEMRARAARGESGETIAQAMQAPVSARTLRRRKAELAGRAPASPASRASVNDEPLPAGAVTCPPPSPPDVPEDVPEGTPMEQLDRWIAACNRGARKAEADGNLQALASLAAKASQLLALRHRSAPLPKPDPNERPDYIALAKQFEDKFLGLVRGIFAVT